MVLSQHIEIPSLDRCIAAPLLWKHIMRVHEICCVYRPSKDWPANSLWWLIPAAFRVSLANRLASWSRVYCTPCHDCWQKVWQGIACTDKGTERLLLTLSSFYVLSDSNESGKSCRWQRPPLNSAMSFFPSNILFNCTGQGCNAVFDEESQLM